MIVCSLVDFGRARYAFVEIHVGSVVRTAYVTARRPINWAGLTRRALRARVYAQ